MTQTVATLFGKLGGASAIKAVVKDFYDRVLKDPDLRGYFGNVDMDRQMRQQVSFLTMALGGPADYDGRSMSDAHRDLAITDYHFDRVARHLVDALASAGVSQDDIASVVSLVGPLKGEIVTA